MYYSELDLERYSQGDTQGTHRKHTGEHTWEFSLFSGTRYSVGVDRHCKGVGLMHANILCLLATTRTPFPERPTHINIAMSL